MKNIKTNTVVLGGGPGGYVAAIRLGQLGIQTILVEANRVGGVCLNIGCIPSKALISSTERILGIKLGEKLGIGGDILFNLQKIQEHKNNTVNTLTSGVEKILKSYGVTIINGWGNFIKTGLLKVKTSEEELVIEYENAIIATGSVPIQLPILPFSHPLVWDSTKALELPFIPKKLAVIGGGIIGLELGGVYASLGSEVVIIEMMKDILPGIPKTAAKSVQRSMKKSLGVTFMNSSKVISSQLHDSHITLDVEGKKGIQSINFDAVLVSVGRKPQLKGFGLASLGIDEEQQYLQVSKTLEVLENHYVIGDLTGPPLLAHKASYQGELAAERISGKNVYYEPNGIPAVAYTYPEVAIVGNVYDSDEIKTGKFQFRANGRALAHGEGEGFVEVFARKKDDVIIGVIIVGPWASELISEATLAVNLGIKATTLGKIMHPHPTLSEALMEAAKAVNNEAIHQLKPK